MKLFICGLTCMAVVLSGSGILLAQEPEAAEVDKKEEAKEEAEVEKVDVGALRKGLVELVSSRRKVEQAVSRARDRIMRSDGLAAESEALSTADKAYREKEQKDPDVAEARKAARDADEGLKAMVAAKLEGNEEYEAAVKAVTDLNAKRGEFEWQRRLAEFKLKDRSSPVSRALDADPELQKLRVAANRTNRNSEEWKAYYAARKAKQASMPEAAKLLEEIAEARKQMGELGKEWAAARRKPDELRRNAERGDDAEIVAAKKRRDEAGTALKEAISEATVEESAARTEARKAIDEKVKELMLADEDAKVAKAKLDEIKLKIATIEKQLKEAGKKKPE